MAERAEFATNENVNENENFHPDDPQLNAQNSKLFAAMPPQK